MGLDQVLCIRTCVETFFTFLAVILGKCRATGEVSSCYCVVIMVVCYSIASVLSKVLCSGDCPLELTKVVSESECVVRAYRYVKSC